jgi:hypothetical protein
VDEAERAILAVAAGQLDRRGFADWVNRHVRPVS